MKFTGVLSTLAPGLKESRSTSISAHPPVCSSALFATVTMEASLCERKRGYTEGYISICLVHSKSIDASPTFWTNSKSLDYEEIAFSKTVSACDVPRGLMVL